MLFRGAFIRFVDLRYDADASASHSRIELTTDFSDTIAEEMGWNPMSFLTDLPTVAQIALSDYLKEHGTLGWIEAAGITSSKLKGSITATGIELIPNGMEMKKYSLSLEANEVRNFSLVRLTDKEGSTTSLELRFQVAISQKGAAARLENYLDHVGQGIAQLKIGYQKQDDLDLQANHEDEEQESEDSPCTACNNGVEFSDDAQTMHTNGQKCRSVKEPALASAKEAAGGTPGRKKKNEKAEATVN